MKSTLPKAPRNRGVTKADILGRVQHLRSMAVNVPAAERLTFVPDFDGLMKHEHLTAANTSLFVEAHFSEALTQYAVGWRDPDLDAALALLAPSITVPERFDYALFNNIEEWFSDASDDDLRAIKGEFTTVEYTESKTTAKVDNRGLRIVLDYDQIKTKPNWQQLYTAKLLRRLRRNRLRRIVAILSAAATNTAKTWDTTAGKDPDQDVLSELIAAGDIVGLHPNRVIYGLTAWAKRVLAFRAQNIAGQGASATMTPDLVAGFLSVDQVGVVRARYQSTASAKAQIVGNKVLMFNQEANLTEEDPSNIKYFASPCEGGMMEKVYIRQISTKLWEIVVENYDLVKITSNLGIRQFTVS